MDARRFDALTRALSRAPSRRDLLRNVPILAAGAIAIRPALARADTDTSGGPAGGVVTVCPTPGPTPVGGAEEPAGPTTGGVAVCLPIASTGGEDAPLPPYAAEIITGTCDEADGDVLFELLEVSDEDGVVGVPPAALMARSVTTVRSPLDDLVDERHSLVVRVSADDPTMVACGEIGGIRDGDDLAVGIRERNNSGFSGVSVLQGSNGSTLVYIYLGRGLHTIQTAPAAVGASVVTTADVNLRSQPAADGEIITVIPAGTTLTVTGSPVGEWVPVEDATSGQTGYVSTQFVEVST
jgi:hypothetical protein